MDEPRLGVKRVMGGVMIVLGFAVALWTLLQVYSLLTAPQELAMLEALSARLPSDRSLVLPDGSASVEVPAVFVKIGAYGTVVALLAVTAGIANAMLRAGTSLLQDDVAKLVRELKKARRD